MSDKPRVNRRRFVQLGAACAGAAGAGLLNGCAKVGVVQAEVDYDTNAIPLDKSEFAELAGSRNAIFVEVFDLDAPIILMKNSESEFVALSAKCTHQACIVRPEKTQIACSCHGSRYSRTGKVTNGPATRELAQYVVKVDDEKIRIEIP